MLRTLRAKLTLIGLLFFSLVMAALFLIHQDVQYDINSQRLISLIGYQSMLTQRITWLALVQPGDPELDELKRQFEENMASLRQGGLVTFVDRSTSPVSPLKDPATLAQFENINADWQAYRHHLDELALLRESDPEYAIHYAHLQEESSEVLISLVRLHEALESQVQTRAANLTRSEVVFISLALVLLVASLFVVQQQVIKPLGFLSRRIREIDAGNLYQPIVLDAQKDEIGSLVDSFEAMRAELERNSRDMEGRVLERTRELSTAFEFSQEIVGELELEQLLNLVTVKAGTLLAADFVSLCFLKPDGSRLELVSQNGKPTQVIANPRSRFEVNATLSAQQAAAVQRFCQQCALAGMFSPENLVTRILQTSNFNYGALCAGRRDGPPFNKDEKQAFSLLVNAASVAINNTFLVEKDRRIIQQLAASGERERLAAELHDKLAQSLGLLKLKLGKARQLILAQDSQRASKEVDDLEAITRTAHNELRGMLENISQSRLTQENFLGEIEQQVAALGDEAGVDADLIVDISTGTLQASQYEQVLNILREALHNIRKHSQASCATLQIHDCNEQRHFTIRDDGVGFDPVQVDNQKHLGLEIMRARAQRSGGHFDLISSPGEGTCIQVSFPLVPKPASEADAQ